LRLLPLRPGFLFLIGAPRLLFTLIVLGVGRRHGLQEQGQNSHIDKSKGTHGIHLYGLRLEITAARGMTGHPPTEGLPGAG
jgi:uncharacterized membrane protein